MFSHEFNVKLRHTDAAGVAFFASYFTIAHDVYELALDELGEPLSAWLTGVPMPLVRSEASYFHPLRHGERVRVDLGVEQVKSRSFELSYRFLVRPMSSARWSSDPGEVSDPPLQRGLAWRRACELKTVHVAINPQSGAAVTLPPRILEALERLGPLDSIDL